MVPADMVAFVDDNLEQIGYEVRRGTLEEALDSGSAFLAIVDDGHAVLIEGCVDLEGVQYLKIRDPLAGSYLERRDILESFRLVTENDSLAWPTLWGERHVESDA